MPAPDLNGEDPPPPPEPLCFTPITAIICLGALVVLAGADGCKTFCVPEGTTEVPGGQGGVPPEPGGGDDGDDDAGDSGKTGGGDDD